MSRGTRRVRSLALLAAAALVGGILGWRLGGPPNLEHLDAPLERAAAASRVDPALLRAMVVVESRGRARARSPKGARGLLQLLPATAEQEARRLGLPWGGPDDLEDAETNLRLGAAYLARLLTRYGGQEPFALAAYNAGPSNLDRWRRRAPEASPLEVVVREGYPETRRYVARVLALRDRYR